MKFELGPKKFQKLALGSKICKFELHKSQPIVLVSTSDHKLEEFYLRDLDNVGMATHPLLMKSLHVNCLPQHFNFSQKNIVHCDNEVLKVNKKHDIIHKANIQDMLIDDDNICLTASQNSIYINSIAKAETLGELHHYGDAITSLFWRNSLVISGDRRGLINLWDINKQTIINSNQIHASEVDFTNSYVDYIHTNLYYTVSKKERRASFHDLRTYRPLKITNNLPDGIIDVQHNPTGKIFIATQKQVQFIDIYQGYSPVGKFAAVSSENMELFMRNRQDCDFEVRTLKKMLIWDKYVIVGCSNGCIEIYDSDLLSCLYGYGMCEFSGIKEMRRINKSLIVLEQKGLLSAALFK